MDDMDRKIKTLIWTLIRTCMIVFTALILI